MTRESVLRELADLIGAVNPDGVTEVAIDGMTAAGKTTLADELAALLAQERPVERMSMDDYQAEPEQRHRRGRYSPEGYYHDAADYGAFLGAVARIASLPGLVILVDGVFLMRPELNTTWDYRVFVDVELDIAYERGIARDSVWMGGKEEARRRYELRYIPSERLYLEQVRPADIADVVIENTDPFKPRLTTRS